MWFMSRFAAQHGDRDIAILHETPAVQAAIEPIGAANRGLLHPFRIGTVSGGFTQQAQGLSHLRLGFRRLAGIVGGGGWADRRALRAVKRLTSGPVETEFSVFRQCDHPKEWRNRAITERQHTTSPDHAIRTLRSKSSTRDGIPGKHERDGRHQNGKEWHVYITRLPRKTLLDATVAATWTIRGNL